MRLDYNRIVGAALTLLDEVGLDALSTRALAERLGVRQPALYWWFPNRRALLTAMNDRMLAEAHLYRTPREGDDWRSFVFANARSFRAALLSRRDGARLHAGTEADPDDLAIIEQQAAFLVQAGWPPVEVMDLLVAVSRYTVGCVLEEQAEPNPEAGALDAAAAAYPILAEAMQHYRNEGPAAAYDKGLRLLVEGAAVLRG